MKRIAYIAAALIAVVGCSKKEVVPETSDNDSQLTVSLKVAGDATKSSFDGESHIKFEKGDVLYAAIASPDAPDTGIEVAGPTGYGYSCVASFPVDADHLDTPVFSGTFKSMEAQYAADKYILYGIFPYSALYSTTSNNTKNLKSWTINIKNDQSGATQTSWDGKADVMLVSPVEIEAQTSAVADTDDKYYNASASASVEFAHLFGFGQLKFADIPAEYADLAVKSVTIETTDDSPAKYLIGKYTVDVTADASDVVLTEGRYYDMYNNIVLKSDGTVKISDYTAWFVANEGTYNVKITVATKKANFVFERKGLEVKRGKITSPTVHFKEVDTAEDLSVDLTDGSTWGMTAFSYSNYLTKAGEAKSWGDNGSKPMMFSITYPGTTNGVDPTYLYGSDGYVQKLASNLVNGGKIVLSSECEFKGMKYVKMNLGIYTNDVSADFIVSVDNGTKVVELGKQTISGTNANTYGTDCYFKTTSESENGVLILTVDNLPKNAKGEYIYVQEYLGGVVVNPAPEIVVDTDKIKVTKSAVTGTIALATYASEEAPAVSVSDDAKDWITVSYADGKISYTIAENAGQKRTGTIIIKLGKSTKEIPVTQASATAVEYKLTVAAKDVKDAIAAAKSNGQTFSDQDTFTASFNAVATDGSGKTSAVEFTFNKLYCNDDSVTDYFKIGMVDAAVTTTSELGFVESAVVVASGSTRTSPNNYTDIAIKTSADGQIWNFVKGGTYEKDGDYYINSFTNEDESQVWFRIFIGWGVQSFKSFEVTYIAG